MLVIKCAACKGKLFKYQKIGKGRVLRCYKGRISRLYHAEVVGKQLKCGQCDQVIGDVETNYVRMDQRAFIYSGRKD